MKRYRHLIPLSLFLLSFGICLGIVVARWWNLRTMLDFAGKNDRPVIAATQPQTAGGEVTLLSLDNTPVIIHIETEQYDFPGPKPIFSLDGSLFFNRLFGRPGAVVALKIPLPSTATCRTTQMIFSSLPENPQGMNVAINRASGIYTYIDRRPRELDRYRIFDFVNQIEYTGEFHLPVPFEFASREYPQVMASGDASRIFATDFTGDDHRLQMYDRSTNTWTEVRNLGNMELQCVSEDGSIVGLWACNSWNPFIFVDGSTGEELHSTMEIGRVTIGKRWIAGSALVRNSNGLQFILIDMEDDWKEYRFGPIVRYWETVSLYEPPSGGISEMMEMRE